MKLNVSYVEQVYTGDRKMSFGNKQLDRAYDRWVTQTPEEYFGYCEDCECGDEQEEGCECKCHKENEK